jgi:hypothetical protein
LSGGYRIVRERELRNPMPTRAMETGTPRDTGR